MKKFFVTFVALFAILIFVASCGGGSKDENETDTDETDTDETVTDKDCDNVDPETDEDSQNSDSTDDADTEAELTEAEKCVIAGGNWTLNAETGLCTKTTDCSDLPGNAEWNGDSTYTMIYSDGVWSPEIDTEYNEESGTCHYKCKYLRHNSECIGVPLALICTGQNKCYDSDGETITCPTSPSDNFYGQDAQYAELGTCIPKSFTVQKISGDNVVVDNNTGLQWQQKLSIKTFRWSNAQSYCEDLTYAGYSDWRLPDLMEFFTISDLGRKHVAFNTTYFTNIADSNSGFWTSQEYNGNCATTTNPLDHLYYFVRYDNSYASRAPSSTKLNAMCVRGSKLPAADFTTSEIDGDTVVTDLTTGLQWQGTFPDSRLTTNDWITALKYCEDLNYAGYSDWRLPNKNELTSLLNYDQSDMPYSDFPNMRYSSYVWSSSTFVENPDNAWSIDFICGNNYHNDKTTDILTYRFKCVR